MSRSERVQAALEIVFVGDHERLAEFYDPGFVDHANALVFRGIDGIVRSAAPYRRLFSGARFAGSAAGRGRRSGEQPLDTRGQLSQASGKAEWDRDRSIRG